MVNQFQISKVQNELMNWSFGIGVAMLILGFLDGFFGSGTAFQGELVAGVKRVGQSSPLSLVEDLTFCVANLLMWWVLHRCLVRRGHFGMQLALVTMMVLTALGAVIGIIPSGDVLTASGFYRQTTFGAFQSRFPFFNSFVVYLAGFVLGTGLIRRYGGCLRLYGWALVVFPLLDSLLQSFYVYLYTSVGGLTLNELNTYHGLAQLAQLALSIGSLALLRRSVSVDADERPDDGSDLNQHGAIQYKIKR